MRAHRRGRYPGEIGLLASELVLLAAGVPAAQMAQVDLFHEHMDLRDGELVVTHVDPSQSVAS